jgi:hypothetical protein
MDIKKKSMNLLLGKIRTYLDAQPEAMKRGKKFIEAEKALAQLEKILAEKVGELVICRKNQPMF